MTFNFHIMENIYTLGTLYVRAWASSLSSSMFAGASRVVRKLWLIVVLCTPIIPWTQRVECYYSHALGKVPTLVTSLPIFRSSKKKLFNGTNIKQDFTVLNEIVF